MLITRKLAHKVQNRLQEVMSYIDLENYAKAKEIIREISFMLNSKISTDFTRHEWRELAKMLKPELSDTEFDEVWDRWTRG